MLLLLLPIRSMSDPERRIVVEVVAHAEVQRLRDEMREMDKDHRFQIDKLRKELEGLHRTFYEFLEAFGSDRRK